MPTLFSPEAWFGMPDPSVFDPYVDKDKQTIDIAGYNAKVKEINATIKKNWETYKSNKDSGAMTWGNDAKGYNHDGLNQGIDHINNCIATSGFNPFYNLTCSDIPKEIAQKGRYINCYTGTHYDFNGNPQTSNPGPCTDQAPLKPMKAVRHEATSR